MNHSPNELVYVTNDSSFETLGLSFEPLAPYAGCRICGQVYQSKFDRETLKYKGDGMLWYDDEYEEWFGAPKAIATKHKADYLRRDWQERHTSAEHTSEEVERFINTGFALTPEAAYKLAPMGFAPVGNKHGEIVDAMGTAPRAPLDDAE